MHAECDAGPCFVPTSRRHFLRDSFLTVAGALVALGMSRSTALAMPLEVIDAIGGSGQTRSYAIPAGDTVQIDKSNDVILVRWQSAVYAFSLSCPHQNTELKWDDHTHTFQCPKHHSEFKPAGEYIPDSGRATRNMDRYAVARDGNQVKVDLDKLYQEDTDTAAWDAAFVKLS